MERLTKRNDDGKAISTKSYSSSYVASIYEEEKQFEQERLERLCEYEDKLESGKLIDISNPSEREKQIDRIMKMNIYLMRKYGDEFRKDEGIDLSDNMTANYIKMFKILDRIAEEMQKEMPDMWYKYAYHI